MRFSKSIIISILFIILISLSVSAKTNYTEAGHPDGLFQGGNGIIFDESTPTITTKTLDNPRLMPYVADLDGDGLNEIIVYDNGVVRLFEADNSLTELTGYDTGFANIRIGNMIIFDIDDDGYTEVIIPLEDDESINILEYNGSDFYRQSRIDLDGINVHSTAVFSASPQLWVKCGGIESCLLVTSYSYSGANTYTGIAIFGMNSTNVSSSEYEMEYYLAGSGDDFNWCLPKIRSMGYADYDNDGTKEYIFNYMERDYNDDSTTMTLASARIANDANRTVTLEEEADFTKCGLDDLREILTESCVNITPMFTSPAVGNWKTTTSNLEAAIGLEIGDNDFKICDYRYSGGVWDEEDDYPEITDGDGKLISNVFIGEFNDEWNGDEFCVLGYNDADGAKELDLLCANEYEDANQELTFDLTGYYDLDNTDLNLYDPLFIITHRIDFTTSSAYDQILTPYGMFSLDYDTNTLTPAAFGIPDTSIVMIPVDAKQIDITNGAEDIIGMTTTNLYYYDDDLQNSPANITQYTVNPCISSAWKTNTSVGVTVRVSDDDNDDVYAIVYLYYGDVNIQNGTWKGPYSSGTDIPFDPDFVANKTIINGELLIQAKDTANNDTIDEISLDFTVNANGVEYGDCVTTIDLTEEAAASSTSTVEDATLTEDATDNSLTTGMLELADLTGLGGTTLWFFIMVVITIAIWYYGSQANMGGGYVVGISMIVNLGMLFIGVRIGIISVAYIVIIAVIAAAIVGLFLAKFLTSHTSQ